MEKKGIEKILMAAYQNHVDEMSQRDRDLADAAAKAAQKLEAEARQAFTRLFGIEPDSVDGTATECTVTCDRVTLLFGHQKIGPYQGGAIWRFVKECPRCGEHRYSKPCTSLTEIAAQMLNFVPGFLHECEIDECGDDPLPLPPPKKPTRHEQILDALYEIANAVRCMPERR